MKNFFEENKTVIQIETACFVPKGTGSLYHENRLSHGVAINVIGDSVYRFADGSILNLPKGGVLFLPKGSTYAVNKSATTEVYAINFQILEDEAFSPCVLTPNSTDAVLNAFRTAERAWRKYGEKASYRCHACLYEIMHSLQQAARAKYVPSDKRRLLAPALEYIHENYLNEKLNIYALANLCGISYEYFRRLFFQCFSQTPVDYVNGLKLQRAKELLKTGLVSVTEAGVQSGFETPEYFSRYFKQKVGVSPSNYQ